MGLVAAEETDADLLVRVRAGDASAWEAMVDRLGSRVWAVVRAYRLGKADAEDVFQVTWMRLMTHLDGIREPDRVGAWLASTARNESLRVLRQGGRQIPSSDELDLDMADPLAPPPDAAVLASERQAAVWKALGALSPPCQRLLRLFMSDPPPTYQEVSEALDMPIGSIGPTRGRCLEHLRRRLGGGLTEAEVR
jgi:RNA polymerase sigma factor (sigma-70 family)